MWAERIYANPLAAHSILLARVAFVPLHRHYSNETMKQTKSSSSISSGGMARGMAQAPTLARPSFPCLFLPEWWTLAAIVWECLPLKIEHIHTHGPHLKPAGVCCVSSWSVFQLFLHALQWYYNLRCQSSESVGVGRFAGSYYWLVVGGWTILKFGLGQRRERGRERELSMIIGLNEELTLLVPGWARLTGGGRGENWIGASARLSFRLVVIVYLFVCASEL